MNKPSKNFNPSFTPEEMLHRGILGGVGLNAFDDDEYPMWKPKGRSDSYDVLHNKYLVSISLDVTQWSNGDSFMTNTQEFFEWYLTYFLGKRDPKLDDKMIKLWSSVVTRLSDVMGKRRTDITDKQKQTLLEWGMSYKIEFDSTASDYNNKRLARKMSKYEWDTKTDKYRRV